MTEGIWVALITAVAGIVGIAIQQARQHKRTKAQSETLEVVRSQVQNDHGTNLRDDVDRVTDAVNRIEQSVSYIASELQGIRKDVGRLDRRDIEDTADLRETRTALERRIDRLEKP